MTKKRICLVFAIVIWLTNIFATVDSGCVFAQSENRLIEIYSGTRYCFIDGTMKSIGKSPVYKDNTIYVSTGLFKECFGAMVTGFTVTIDDVAVEFFENSKKIKIGAYEAKLNKETFLYSDVLYVPLAEVCKALDIAIYVDGRFAVFGNKEQVFEIKERTKNNINEYCIEQANALTASSKSFQSTDYENIMKRWTEMLVGSENVNNMSDKNIKSVIENRDEAAGTAMNQYIASPEGLQLFYDIPIKATADMSSTASRIYTMALAWGTYGSKYYQNSEILEIIKSGLDWMYENVYGIDEDIGTGWKRTTDFNWYDWQIGTPKSILYSTMIIRSKLTSTKINHYTYLFNKLCPSPVGNGSNYIETCELIALSALLKKDKTKLTDITKKAQEGYLYVDGGLQSGQGFYKDGSYLFHLKHPMNGAYGITHFSAASDFAKIFANTYFALPKACTDNMLDWYFNSFEPFIFEGSIFRIAVGRDRTPYQTSYSPKIIKVAINILDLCDSLEREKLEQSIFNTVKKGEVNGADDYYSALNILQYICLKQIMSNNYEYDKPQGGCSRVFSNIDQVVHKTKDWAIGIQMSSSRIYNYESINNANLWSWYLGDGRTEVHLHDAARNYSTNSVFFWNNVDMYRLPGTTVDDQKRRAVSIAQGNEYLSSKDFVGGASLNDETSVAAMCLESYHNDSDYGLDHGSYGGKAPAHQSDLTAKKSYFMFDNSVYCLGADINASDNNNANVMTIVENRMSWNSLRNGTATNYTEYIGNDPIYLNGVKAYFSAKDSSYDVKTLSKTDRTVNFNNECGYYFPSGAQNVKFRWTRKAKTTLSDKPFFEIWFEHGQNPQGENYAYAILPNMTKDNTEEYSKNPDVQVLNNTGIVQAVKNTRLNVTGIVFWEAGTFEGITVTEPMILIVKENDGELQMSVADPTHKLKNAEIIIDRNVVPFNLNERIDCVNKDSKTYLKINFVETNGQSLLFNAKANGMDYKLNFFDNNEEISPYFIQTKDQFSCVAKAYNLTSDIEEAYFITAIYSNLNELISADIHKHRIDRGDIYEYVINEKAVPEGAERIEIFVWDKMKPFTKIQ